jgi:hypothetical protein
MYRSKYKKCPACNKEKERRFFGVRPCGNTKSYCKKCAREKQRKYTKNNQNKIQEYKENNKEVIAERKKRWRDNNPDYNKQYYEANKDRIRKKKAEYDKQKRETDPMYKLRKNLRTRLYHALKGQARNGSAVRDMGCTVEELRKHLESEWQEGMSWDNYGEWHIDHVVPLSRFNLSDRTELLRACHYTNLQPLWAKENILKKDMVHGG